MRISKKEVDSIIEALSVFIININAELRLYGSRVDDHAKGGDIDLLLIVSAKDFASQLIYKKPEILVAIKKLLGERRVDLTITTFAEISEDPFLKSIIPKSILLKAW
jgi:predicted nucleotidyltransferase